MVPLRFELTSVRARIVAPLAALVAAAFLASVPGAMAADEHDHSAPGHTHDAPAAKPATTPAAKAGKAVPDSLPGLEAAVKKDSTSIKAIYRLGIAYLDRDNPLQAADMFNRATRLKPDYVEAWVNLGAAEDANGHGGAARSAYRTALKLRPGDEIAQCRMASSFYANGMKDSAMAELRSTLEKNPKSHCSYFTMGVAYADAGMFREAIRVWQKVVEYAPDSPEAESAKESIKLLQEYLGPQEALATPQSAQAGVPIGSGGPGEPLPGGEMNTPKGSKASSSTPPKDAKSAVKTGGAK